MKLTILFEDFDATLEKLKQFGISKLSQQEKEEIDAEFKKWLITNKKRWDGVQEFNSFLKELGLEVKS